MRLELKMGVLKMSFFIKEDSSIINFLLFCIIISPITCIRNVPGNVFVPVDESGSTLYIV